MSRTPRILAFCSRGMYADEAAVIAYALSSGFGIETLYVGADFEAAPTADALGYRSVPAPGKRRTLKARMMQSAVLDATANLFTHYQARRRIAALLGRERPDAVVVFDDRQLKPDWTAIEMARGAGIPSILVPYAVSTLEADLLLRRDDPRHAAPPRPCGNFGRLAAQRHRDQVRDGTLFYPAAVTLALGALGHLPRSPWLLGANGADHICVLDRAQRDLLQSARIGPSRVHMTGQATTDALSLSDSARAGLATSLRQRYGLSPDAPILMCAVPQHAEHGMAGNEAHRASSDRLFAALAASGAGVLLSLHPKSDRAHYAALASRHGLRILDERLSSVLAVAQIFVAAFSSTVRWAIGLGIPAVVIDDIATGYQVYRDILGITVVDSHDALAHVLRQACTSQSVLDRMRTDAQRGAERIGRIDGRAAGRIADVIAAAAKSKADPASASLPFAPNSTNQGIIR